jgi:hypothetical protein
MRDHLETFEPEIRALEDRTPELLEEAALLWRITTHMALKLRDRHPHWLFHRYEDLARDPVNGFSEIFSRLNLELTPKIQDRIAGRTHPNIFGWKRDLSSDEIATLRTRVDGLAEQLYPDEDW